MLTRQIVMIEGNGSRPSHKGDGFRQSNEMYTLNTIEVHKVAYVLIEHHPSDSRTKIATDYDKEGKNDLRSGK